MESFNCCGAYLDRTATYSPIPTSPLLRLGLVLCLLSIVADHCRGGESSLIQVDYRRLTSRADLVYESPVHANIDGIPIGNGTMGTTVWTTPHSVNFQVNRKDVFATDKYHAGHHYGPGEYWGACAQIEVDLGGQPLNAGEKFRQHLSVHDAVCTISGESVRLRCFVSSAHDVLILEVDDQRPQPHPLRVTISMWRAPEVTTRLKLWNSQKWISEEVNTGTHTARYEFKERDGEVLVVQELSEVRSFCDHDYYCASAVAAKVVGEKVRVEVASERSRTIVAPAKKGKRTIVLSSAASLSRSDDVGTTALDSMETATKQSFDALLEEHTRWWHEFWQRTFVHITSQDGVADFMERIRTLHMYYTASTSRGDAPVPNGSGLLFKTRGDLCHLGAQHWHWITEMMYTPLFAADALDLTDPYFNMYVRQLPDCRIAARQRWGVAGGAFFSETLPFNGPVVLPEDSAKEFREYFLGQADSDSLSAKTRVLCQYESQLHYTIHHDRTHRHLYPSSSQPFSAIGHLASTGSKIALHSWWRYRCTGDKQWLREKAYPLLRDTIEFYRHLLKQGDDGLYRMVNTNVMEAFKRVDDSLMDYAAIRGTAPLAIKAAQILSVDRELQAKWQEMLDNLAPYPMGNEPASRALKWGTLAEDVWAAGHLREVNIDLGRYPSEDVWLFPVFPFETWTLETRDGATDTIVRRLTHLCPNYNKVMTGRRWRPSLVRTPMSFARAGQGEQLPAILAAHFAAYSPHLANGLSVFEAGIQSMGVEHSGLISTTIQEALLQSVSAHPGQPEIISICPAWPRQWDASFRLLARGGFLVSSSVRSGEVEFVEIQSRLGEPCRLRNPWARLCLVIQIGGAEQELAGDILRFDTRSGRHYRVVPKDSPESSVRDISPEPATGPVSYSYVLPSGVIVEGSLGRSVNMPPRGLEALVNSARQYAVEDTKFNKRRTVDQPVGDGSRKTK